MMRGGGERAWRVVLLVALLLSVCGGAGALVITDVLGGSAGLEAALYLYGRDVSLAAAGGQLPSGEAVTVEVVTASAEDVSGVVLGASASGVAMGPFDSALLREALLDPALEGTPAMCFAPLLTRDDVRVWTPHAYYPTASPTAEALAMLTHAVNVVDSQRLGVVRLGGSGMGEDVLAMVQALAPLVAASEVSVYEVGVLSEYDPQQLAMFMLGQPQTVLLFGVDGAHLRALLEDLLEHYPLAALMVPFHLMAAVTQVYAALRAAGGPGAVLTPPESVYFTTPHPLAGDERFAAMRLFAEERAAVETSGGVVMPMLPAGVPAGVGEAYAVAGWVAGKLLLTAAELHGTTPVSSLVQGMFLPNRYVVGGDLVVGDFAGPCEGMLDTLGMTCSCNQGGNRVFVSQLQALEGPTGPLSLEGIPEADYAYPLGLCEPEALVVKRTIAAVVSVEGDAVLARVAGEVAYGLGSAGGVLPAAPRVAAVPAASVGAGGAALTAALNRQRVTVLVGPLGPWGPVVERLAVVDPVGVATGVHVAEAGVLYLTATVEQELFVLAEFVAAGVGAGGGGGGAAVGPMAALRAAHGVGAAVGVVGVSADVVAVTVRSLESFEVEVGDALHVVGGGGDVLGRVLRNGTTFVSGLREQDVAPLVALLRAETAAVVVVPFEEVTRLYAAFQGAVDFLADGATERLLFATNVPEWMDGFEAAGAWGAARATPAEFRTPAALRGRLAAAFVDEVARGVYGTSAEGLLDAVYARGLVTVGADGAAGAPRVYGPFVRRCTQVGGAVVSEVECLLNYGARDVYVWQYRRVLEPAVVGPLAGPVTPTMVYDAELPVLETRLSTTSIVAIVAAIVAAVLLVLVILYFVFCCRGDSRDNRYAPKDGEVPVTLLFTDIESSTSLWSLVPQEMSRAVELHHRMIRALIVKHECYEVKTIGDAFMIACREAEAGVLLAQELQEDFLNCDWGTRALDETYAQLAQQKGGAGVAGRAEAWSGLRVRVGLHRGLSDIRYDEVTKGYDYYGATSNIAARTESLASGGQVLMTQAVYEALGAELLARVSIVPAGAHYLRGVPEPVPMHELCAVEGRRFAELSTEKPEAPPLGLGAGAGEAPGGVAAEDDLGDILGGADVDGGGTQRSALDATADVLQVYYSAYSQKDKIRMLKKTCKYFRVQAPERRHYSSDEVYVNALVKKVATRTAGILEYKQRQALVSRQPSLVPASVQAHDPRASVISCGTQTAERGAGDDERFFDEPVAATAECGIDCALSAEALNAMEGDTEKRMLEVMSPLAATRPMTRVSSPHAKSFSMLLNSMLDAAVRVQSEEEEDASPKLLPRACLSEDVLTLESTTFVHGRPTAPASAVTPCFAEGNGLLFRLVDGASGQWAFYNDTTTHTMVVSVSLGRRSRVVALGRAVLRRDVASGRLEGVLVVPPLKTELLLQGEIGGYRLKYKAVPCDGSVSPFVDPHVGVA